MSYVKQTWVDRAVEFFRRFSASEDVDGNISLTEEPGLVTEAGTPLDATRLNHMEDGIEAAHDDLADLAGAGRTTETVKGNADDIDEIKAGGDTDGRFATMPWVGTAPIVESGSNTNGSYIKYADGTLICSRGIDFAGDTVSSETVQGLTAYRVASKTFGWAHNFIDTNYRVMDTRTDTATGTRPTAVNFTCFSKSTSEFAGRFIGSLINSNGFIFDVAAIGRWK